MTPEPCDRVTAATTAQPARAGTLEAHRTQYALDPELLPRRVLRELLGVEHFLVAAAGRAEPT